MGKHVRCAETNVSYVHMHGRNAAPVDRQFIPLFTRFYTSPVVQDFFHQQCVTFTFRLYVPWSKVAILGMVIPPLIGNPYNGYINPYYWVDEFIPYYMEIMGVDRPDRTFVKRNC